MLGASSPDSASSLIGCIKWISQTLLGSAATIIAILAIASIGLILLSGRVSARRAATTIIGCFILFGAATIANAIIATLNSTQTQSPAVDPAPAYTPSVPRPTSADPYAGASVPDQRSKDISQ